MSVRHERSELSKELCKRTSRCGIPVVLRVSNPPVNAERVRTELHEEVRQELAVRSDSLDSGVKADYSIAREEALDGVGRCGSVRIDLVVVIDARVCSDRCCLHGDVVPEAPDVVRLDVEEPDSSAGVARLVFKEVPQFCSTA